MRSERKALRRVAALIATIAAALFMGTVPAYADNGPHVSTATYGPTTGNAISINNAGAGRCASCHRAHTAQSAYLLNAATQEALCFSCHGSTGTGASTDVQDGVGYGTTSGALRGGGFDKAAIGTSTATKDIGTLTTHGWSSINQLIPALSTPVATNGNHLNATAVMWGNGAIGSGAGKVMSGTTTLECGSCHDPHGNGQYRILRPVPSDSGFTTTVGTNTQPGIFIQDTKNKVYTTTNYWISGDPAASDTLTTTYVGATSLTDPTPLAKPNTDYSGNLVSVSSFQANIGAWCTTCHTRYLAPSGSYKTSSTDPIFTYRHRSDRATGEKSSPNCTQCHVAHGSNALMPRSNVLYPDGSGPSQDSRLLRVDDRGVCVLCHNI